MSSFLFLLKNIFILMVFCYNIIGDNMKKQKGFTLIELLAVIVILAIIALIATPIILNMISKARKSAAKDSALGYIDAINYNNDMSSMNSDYETGHTKINDGTYDVDDVDIKLKGKKPVSGTVTILNGRVSSLDICISGYNVTSLNGKDVEVGTRCSDSKTYTVYTLGQLVQYDPVENKKCTSGSTCYKWRVITTDDTISKSNITLQMDHNLVNLIGWLPTGSNTTIGPTTALPALATATAGWDDSLLLNYTYDTTASGYNYGTLTCIDGSCKVAGNNTPIANNLKARIITGEEITAITKTKASSLEWTLANSYTDIYYFSRTNKQIGTNINGTGNTDLAWLIENTKADIYSGASANTYESNNSGYWTLSPVSDAQYYAWDVNSDGALGVNHVTYGNYGLRPVITIKKSKLS